MRKMQVLRNVLPFFSYDGIIILRIFLSSFVEISCSLNITFILPFIFL